jgi:hypothetical protein
MLRCNRDNQIFRDENCADGHELNDFIRNDVSFDFWSVKDMHPHTPHTDSSLLKKDQRNPIFHSQSNWRGDRYLSHVVQLQVIEEKDLSMTSLWTDDVHNLNYM